MKLNLVVIDAFADRAFTGNSAAVCMLPFEIPAHQMQQAALEMNLSETAFLLPQGDGWNLRWFTPNQEVDLCGHATLAAAHMLGESNLLAEGDTARFYTRSGLLTAQRSGNMITLNFPVEPALPVPVPNGLEEALGADLLYVGLNRMDYLVQLASETIVRSLQPNASLLAHMKARGVIVTAQSDNPQYHFVSRCFYPACGVNEDPVTGSAHCALAPFWAERLKITRFSAYQASARGGSLYVELLGDRVELRGRAVTTMQCQMQF